MADPEKDLPAEKVEPAVARDAGAAPKGPAPVRGGLRLEMSVSSPQVIAGTPFSIFINIQNPFDVPITVSEVLTHIPVELVDVNGFRLLRAKLKAERKEPQPERLYHAFRKRISRTIAFVNMPMAVAVAVGAEFSPETNMIGEKEHWQKGLAPVVLQPGDSVVRQFVLCTRHWLFFTPLTHLFQIQVNFSIDEVRHSQTVTHQMQIRSIITAMVIGAVVGAVVGSLLKSLSASDVKHWWEWLRAAAISVLAACAVVVAFARKSTAQSLISVEDFWGGAFIGFSVGFFGFEQFSNLFSGGTPQEKGVGK